MASPRNLWPIGLTIFIVLFVAVTVTVVFFISRERVDMVTDRAYERGVDYEARLDVLKRSEALPVKPVVDYDAVTRVCTVRFADSTATSQVTGSVRFFRGSDARRDFEMPITLDATGMQRVPIGAEQSGRWTVQLSWTRNGLAYYFETPLFVP
jgi:hypothetical protein